MSVPPTQELGEGEQRGYQALFTVNEMVNLCDPSDPASFPKARARANVFFSQRNGDSQHTAHAMGHCHIDSGLFKVILESAEKYKPFFFLMHFL